MNIRFSVLPTNFSSQTTLLKSIISSLSNALAVLVPHL